MTEHHEASASIDEDYTGEPAPQGTRQTRTYLKEMLAAHGLRPRRQLGQNFLIDLNLLQLLFESAPIGPDDVVLEVGAGTGGLTTRLASRAKHVVSVEIDAGFYALARNEIAPFANVTLIHADALKNKNHFNPEVLAVLADAMKTAGVNAYHLVANLPYDVASPVIGNLLLEDLPVRSMTVTLQLEMGQRLTARPGHEGYGPLSVLIPTLGHADWIRTLPPQVFWPRPKVTSTIIRVMVDERRRQNLDELREWYRFVRDLFIHRRKSLRPAIARIPGYKRLKPHLDPVLAELGLAPDARAEQLDAEQLLQVYRKLRELSDRLPAE